MVNGTSGNWGGQTKAPAARKKSTQKETGPSIVGLDAKPRLVHAHGITGGIRNNAELMTIPDENGVGRDHVLCPVGQRLGLLRLDDQRMCFLEGTNSRTFRSGAVREILSVTLSPNRKHIALCERVIEPTDPSIVSDIPVANRGGEGAGGLIHGVPQYFVSVHHNIPSSLKHKKLTMTYAPPVTSTQPPLGGVRFGRVAFSADSKLLVAVADGEYDEEPQRKGGTPGPGGRATTRDGNSSLGFFTMVVWEWQKDKMIAAAHFQQNPKDRMEATRVSFNPSDKSCITTSGFGCLKQWTLLSLGAEISPRSLLPPNKCADNFVDHAWMNGKSVGSEPPDRRLIVVTDGNSTQSSSERNVFSAQGGSHPSSLVRSNSLRGNPPEQRRFQVLVFAPEVDNPANLELVKSFLAPLPATPLGHPPCTVETITSYGKGFIVAGGGGFMQLWDRTEHSDLYTTARTLSPDGIEASQYSVQSSKSTASVKAMKAAEWGEEACFSSLSVHLNDELLVAVTKNLELVTFPLGSLEVMEEAGSAAYGLFTHVAAAHDHGKRITCMETCVCKPLLVTGSDDCTVRLWDYSSWRSGGDIIWKSGPGDGPPNDISVHPTGNCILIAYESRVCLMTVLLDCLKPFREISITKCRVIQYAHGGHLFACSNGSSVSLRDSLSLNELAVYSAHVAPVNSILWADDDLSIFSGGSDGSVHGWDLPSGQRIDELGGIHSSAQVISIAVAVPPAAFASPIPGAKVHARGAEARARNAPDPTAAERAAGRAAAVKAASTATAVALCWDGSLREISWRHPPLKADKTGRGKPANGLPLKEEGPELYCSLPVVTPEAAASGLEEAASLALSRGRSLITCMVRCKTKPFLIAGSANGCVHIYAWPLRFPMGFDDDVSLDESQAGSEAPQAAKQLLDVTASEQLPPHFEIEGHSCCIETMCLSFNDNLLFTGGADGTVLVFKLDDIDERLTVKSESEDVQLSSIQEPSYVPLAASTLASIQVDVDSDLFNKEVTQASLEALEERQEEVEEALKKIEDIKHENAYTLHQQKTEWERKLARAVEAASEQEIESKAKYDALAKDKEALQETHGEFLERLETVHSSSMIEIEAQYEKKLRLEMDRFDRLSEEIERVQQHCEELIGAQQVEHKRLLKNHDADARRVEKELRSTVERLTEDEKHNAATFKEVLDQQEQEYEAELQALMLAAQKELSAERASTSRMRVMVQERNAAIEGLKKKGEDLKSETHRQDIALADHKLRNSKLEATLEHFRRHMVERESTLGDKEKAIQNLRRTNLTLDNFRFVLDHRVQQLLEERAPISNHINDLEEHIDSMYDELENEYQSKQLATQDMDSKAMKINTLTTELATLESRLREKENFINGMKRDLSALVSLSNPKEIEDAVKDAYQKFVKDERPRKSKPANWSKTKTESTAAARGSLAQELAAGGALEGEADSEMGAALKEAYHQRDCVEKMKNNLAHKLELTKREAAKAEIIKLDENSKLMTECNSLRTENLTLKRKVDHLRQVLRHCEAEDRKRKDTPKSRPATADPKSRVQGEPGNPFSPLPSVTFSPMPIQQNSQFSGSDSLDSQSHISAALSRAKQADLLTVKKVNTSGSKKGGLTESGLRFERAAVLAENSKLVNEVEENERIISLQKLEMNALKGGQSFPRVARSGPTQRREVLTLRPRLPDTTVGVRGLLPGDNTVPSTGPFSSKPAKLQER